MSERTRSVVLAGAILVLAGTLVMLVATAPTEEDRVARIGGSIMCPVCQGESILGSPAPMARDMMDLVGERVAQGASDAEIVDELLSSYTGAILLDPPVRGPTVVLWLAPAVALIAGLGVIIWWRRHPGDDSHPGTSEATQGRGRRAVGALTLIAAFSLLVVAVGFFLQERDQLPGGGLADLAVDSLDDVSNETMEAVIAANPETPGVIGMRLALADRYFREGEYRSAFPHYLTVAESADSSDEQTVAALLALGWMTWDGNRQADTAIGLFDQALAIAPQSVPARYMKSQVLWCGGVSPSEAENLLRSIVDQPSTADDWVALANSDLEAIRHGEQCT